MEFRKEINGVLLAVCAGVWATVAVGQGQGPSLSDLLLPDADSSASAAKPADKPAPRPEAKPAGKAVSQPVAKPAEKPVEKPAAKPEAKPAAKPAEKPVAKPVEKPAEKPVAKATEKPAVKEPVPVAKSPLPVAAKTADEKPAEKKQPEAGEADEINLSEIDDSAEAVKGRPVVKLAESAPAPTPVPAAAPSSTPAAPAPATGSEIAARFLASDETALVDITSDNASLTDILRQFRRATGANIIYAESSNLQQRVSVSLKHVPWLQGMKSILNSRGFRVESTGGIHFIKEDKVAEPIFTRTFQLNHASVDELAKLFNESYGTKGKDGKLIKGVATAFQGANTIVVTASDRVLADCESIIKAVDKAVPQIYIEARFVELSNDAMHKLGVDWSQLESWGASVRSVTAGMEYNNGRAANYGMPLSERQLSANNNNNTTMQSGGASGATSGSTSTSTSTSTSSSQQQETYNALIPSSIVSAPGAGRSAENMNWHNARGFSGQLSLDDFRLAMSAFETMSDAKVFSNPRIIVSNGREAKVDMTTKYPNVTINSDYAGQNSQYLTVSTKLDVIPGEDKFMFAKEAFFSWGIQLSVTPRISPDGLISVEIVPTISDHKGDVIVGSAANQDLPYAQYPIIEIKRLLTEFTMKDGATAVIGGLSKTEETDQDAGIPYLRKIPWIGQKLFGWKGRQKIQKEILIFVTVGIADPANLPEDIGLPKNAVRGREYVEKRAFEPGDRPNAASDITKLDMRTLDERHAAEEKKSEETEPRGTVTITPVVQ